jgi:hypothetical protein
MSTDWRALCAELADSVDRLLEMRAVDAKLMAITEDRLTRALHLLAQPEPVVLTNAEMLRCYCLAKRDHCYEGPIDDWPKRAERAATVHGLRAVIAADRARWGRPAIQPVPVAEEEVATLVAALRADAECVAAEQPDLMQLTDKQLTRVADLLQRSLPTSDYHLDD